MGMWDATRKEEDKNQTRLESTLSNVDMHLKCLKIFSPQPKSARINGNSHLSSVVTRITLCLLIYAGQAAQWGGHPLGITHPHLANWQQGRGQITQNLQLPLRHFRDNEWEVFSRRNIWNKVSPAFFPWSLPCCSKLPLAQSEGTSVTHKSHEASWSREDKKAVVFPREVKQLTTKWMGALTLIKSTCVRPASTMLLPGKARKRTDFHIFWQQTNCHFTGFWNYTWHARLAYKDFQTRSQSFLMKKQM